MLHCPICIWESACVTFHSWKIMAVHPRSNLLPIAAREAVDAVLIAGDVYDKGVPPAEAVALLDQFLTVLAGQGCSVCLIAGNHDSAERLSFGAKLMDGRGVYFAPVYDGAVRCVTLQDGFGPVHLWLLPFLKPAVVRRVWPEESVETYSDALQCALSHVPLDPSARNVLLSHQFVTGAVRCESEEISVGGLDNVDAAVYEAFDYVALGHLHGAQCVGMPHICYCGTLLKYSVSESGQEKALTLVTLSQKGAPPKAERLALHPLRDVKKKRGNLAEILEGANEKERDDYVSITLTDEVDPYKPKEQLEEVFDRILEVKADNTRTRNKLREMDEELVLKDPLETFCDFYQEMQGRQLAQEELEIMKKMFDEAEGEER